MEYVFCRVLRMFTLARRQSCLLGSGVLMVTVTSVSQSSLYFDKYEHKNCSLLGIRIVASWRQACVIFNSALNRQRYVDTNICEPMCCVHQNTLVLFLSFSYRRRDSPVVWCFIIIAYSQSKLLRTCRYCYTPPPGSLSQYPVLGHWSKVCLPISSVVNLLSIPIHRQAEKQ